MKRKSAYLPEKLANLTPEQRDLLLHRVQQRTAARDHKELESIHITPAARDGELPLSFAQQRLWFLDQLALGSAHYNLFHAVRLAGALSVAALERALHAILQRHEVLRTTFTAVDGRPIQVIAPPTPFDRSGASSLTVIDLCALPPDERERAAQRLAGDHALRPFDLTRGPLVHVTLLRLGKHEHLLFLAMHHIISDAWSMNILVREIIAGYTAADAGQELRLPPLPIQYVDYALWQRQRLQGAMLEQQSAYWRAQLAGLSVLELPTDDPRPAVQSFRGAGRHFTLPHSLSDALLGLSRRMDTTLFMTLLAAWQTLLFRYSGQDDIVVGTPIAGRTHAELEPLIGFFVNTLVLRTNLGGNPSFSTVLQRVRSTCLDAYAHQDLPFEQLVEVLQPQRDLSRHPLFQVMFVLQNIPPAAMKHAGLDLEEIAIEHGVTKFDLTLRMSETPDGLIGAVEYCTNLFEAATIARLIAHFQILLEGIVADPDGQISALPLLPPAELQQVLVDWNATTRPFPPPACIHTRFETQADRIPDAVALVFEDQRLTYGALNARANQLAHHLRQRGAGPNIPVGICIDRSLDMIVGLLAILKAGAAYLPLDPAFPPQRLAFMLQDAGALLLLTSGEIGDWRLEIDAAEQSPISNLQSQIVDLIADWPTIAQQPATAPISASSPDQLVYVIYTSGSTGRPKGVAVEHRQLDNYVSAILERLALPPSASFATVSTIAADLGNTGIYAALCGGGCLHIIAHDHLADPLLLADYFRRQPVDCLKIVPSHLSALLSAPHPAQLLPRQRLILGGEASSWELVAQVQAFAPGCRVFNHYGPTETTVGVFTYAVEPDSPRPPTRALPLGRPLANITSYLLDPNGRPVPLGVPGEVYIGGAGVARGYLHRPELTAERFVPNPFVQERLEIGDWRLGGEVPISNLQSPISERLYKTGDLARYLPDGTLEFLGRIDGQVKLRGFRIELGEIATVLRAHPSVREAVATLREDQPGGKRLVAYVVPRDWRLEIGDSSGDNLQSPISNLPQELRQFLRDRLPDYMLPAAFVVLEALPLTLNGKLDRAALPAPDQLPAAEPALLPRTPTETAIAEIWAALLGQKRVSIHDNFFTLGGHSLLATQVIVRVRQLFSIELPLRALFEAPTVAGLSERVMLAQQAAPVPPIVPVTTEQPLPLSFSQERLWFLQQLLPTSPAYNVPYYLRLQGALDRVALEQSLNEILRRHAILRTAFPAIGGQPVQVIEPAQPLTLQVVDVAPNSAAAQDVVRQLAFAEASRPFQLAQTPLLRALLICLGPHEHVLLVTMHHIVSDAWSRGVLVRELTLLYDAWSAGQPSPLPALAIQYADYAVWQRQWLRGAVQEQQLAYWRQQLADAPVVLELPTDHPRSPVSSFEGAVHPLTLPPAMVESLQQLSRQAGGTLFMTLLAAFQTLLYRYSGQDDLLVGAPIAGRTHPETEQLIGCFINMLVLRGNLRGNPTFRALLERVRETTLGAYAHQDLPFELLVETLQPARDLSRQPLFQVVFILQNAPMQPAELAELTLAPLQIDQRTAKFDLTLTMTETPDGLSGGFEYRTDLFEAATIARLAGHFETLLGAIAVDPALPVSALPVLTEVERRQLLVEWNESQAEYPCESCFHELFEAVAARTPSATAVVCEGQQISYGELNERANQLAHHLRSLGVGPDSLVAICMERSLEVIVAIVGIHKAGGAYVPLDPAYPAERLRYMLEDAQVSVVLTSGEIGDWRLEIDAASQSPISNLQPPAVVNLQGDWHTISRQPTTNPERVVQGEHLAYIIYTSGSTGRPKGVMVTQHGLLNLCYGLCAFFDDPSVTTTALITSFSFDISVNQIFPTLLFGRTLHIIPDAVKYDSRAFVQYLTEQRINLFDAVPSYLNAVLTEISPERVANQLRFILVGGERLEKRLLVKVFEQLGKAVQIVNIYGLTEITDINSLAVIGAEDLESIVTIGRPLQNNRIYITNRHGSLQPVGIIGEVCISGESVSRGYLNRPELTAEKFAVCPFEDGALMVRTGDVGRRLSDGTIELLGRIDHQIKLRGFRIEIGEIEALLDSHHDVREVVVVVREDLPGQRRLVAYVVPRDWRLEIGDSSGDNLQSPISNLPQELRQFLKTRLPDYMLPTAFVVLDELPHTPNGKIDRKALPAPGWSSELEGGFVAPRTPTEELLAAIWAEVLGQRQFGVEDNFFELGGHSLLATRVLARVRSTFAVELPLRTLFETPTIAELAAELERLRHGQTAGALPELRPVARTEPLPLSFAQQRLWFLDQLAPNSPAYNIASAFRLAGRLDQAALRQSVLTLVRRHEILRTTFALVDDQPVQVIHQNLLPELEVVDLRKQDHSTRLAKVSRRVAAQAQRPFDLACGPLLRLLLLRLADDDQVLLLTLHHIIFDGWSLGLLIKELAALYSAADAQRATDLPPLPIQYADYAVWQRQWLRGELLERQLAYWRGQLASAPAALELPTDHPRPPLQSLRGARHSIALDRELSASLVALSRRQQVTLFMTLLAAWQVLLSRYSHQTDICVGSPIAGRSHPAAERLIGCFVNTLVLRTNLAGEPSFRAVLEQVREVALGAYAHQDLPFEMLVEALEPERNLSRTPLFQVMFALQNAPQPEVALAEVRFLPLEQAGGSAKFDLTLVLWETAVGLVGSIEYNCDLFEAPTIARLAGHFQLLLAGIAADPERPISALPLLPADERQQLLVEWNRTQADYPQDGCLHEWFEEQATRTPDAVAVVDQHQTLTYAALNGRANQLAHYLQSLQVGPETLVGVCLDRSVTLVVALLGILKAGAAYLPLDPAYPADRLAFMLEDAQVAVLLTNKEIGDWRLEIDATSQSPISNLQSPVIDLDADWETIARQPAENLESAATPQNAAYVIYTSGSTGRPKGVLISHRAIGNHMRWMQATFALTAADRVLQKTPMSFDASVWEFYAPLLAGAQLIMAEPDGHQDSGYLVRAITQQQVSILQLVPSMLRALLEEPGFGACRSLRRIFCGGEALPGDLVEQCARLLPAELCNLYGPTEASIDATYWICGATDARHAPPIGRPISNTQTYILDDQLQPVPIGIAGELYLGGAGLARGYLRRPDLTAERFVPNPFLERRLEIRDWRLGDEMRISNLQSPISDRLYRTGDLCRYCADGTIEYLGRIDHQIKLRGFRIELGEIATVLRMHSSVREAVAIVREDRDGDRRLVAYIVPTTDHRPPTTDHRQQTQFSILNSQFSIQELRDYLKTRLPNYMIPSAFVTLEALPLTPNGKLDRRALPGPEPERMIASRLIPARDMLEFQLVRIWEETLNVRPIGVTDQFFELGGHSLLAVKLMARVQRLMGVSLPLAALFRHATVEQLALALRRQTQPATPSALVGIRTSGANRPFFCIHPLGGNVLCYADLAHYLGSEQPVYGIQSLGLEDGQAPLTQVEAMAAHYIEAIRSVQPEGPYLLGGWSVGGVLAVEVAQQLRAQGQTLALLALLDSFVPAPAQEPLPDDALLLIDLARQYELELDHMLLTTLDPEQRLAHVLEQAQRSNLMPLGLDLAQVWRLFDVYKSNVRALQSYSVRPYDGRVTLFRAGDAPEAPDPTHGWGAHAADGVELHVIPGRHHSILREPDVQYLAEQLRLAIARTQSDCLKRESLRGSPPQESPFHHGSLA